MAHCQSHTSRRDIIIPCSHPSGFSSRALLRAPIARNINIAHFRAKCGRKTFPSFSPFPSYRRENIRNLEISANLMLEGNLKLLLLTRSSHFSRIYISSHSRSMTLIIAEAQESIKRQSAGEMRLHKCRVKRMSDFLWEEK